MAPREYRYHIGMSTDAIQASFHFALFAGTWPYSLPVEGLTSAQLPQIDLMGLLSTSSGKPGDSSLKPITSVI